MTEDLTAQAETATCAIVESKSGKKLIVAGPGAGKTFTFRRLLSEKVGHVGDPIVLTFINNLKDDLERELSELARVYTFHGFCRSLLHSHRSYRQGLTESFDYYPPLPGLIKSDWEATRGSPAPQFIAEMRSLDSRGNTEFYAHRATYYDAVSYDDSVFRVHDHLERNPDEIPSYPLVLVDEYQDFNQLEVSFINLLGERAPVIVAGDDDQALYANLRGSNPQFIRHLYGAGEFDVFELPFSMRCTEPIVNAVRDIIGEAQSRGLLLDRIPKKYEYFPPRKASDTHRYPAIKAVRTSVQSKRNNYFGRYVEQEIAKIPPEEIQESHADHFPTVLIVGPRQYLRQVQEHLTQQGLACELSQSGQAALDRLDALHRIQLRPGGNLGWRILLETDHPLLKEQVIGRSVAEEIPLVELLPSDFKAQVASEVDAFVEDDEAADEESDEQQFDDLVPTIRLTSFEGAKGLQAQRVFVVGLHAGDIPRDPANISDIEVCKFLVALTRTRKQCHLLHTPRWGAQRKMPSPFVSWVARRTEGVRVDKNYWRE